VPRRDLSTRRVEFIPRTTGSRLNASPFPPPARQPGSRSSLRPLRASQPRQCRSSLMIRCRLIIAAAAALAIENALCPLEGHSAWMTRKARAKETSHRCGLRPRAFGSSILKGHRAGNDNGLTERRRGSGSGDGLLLCVCYVNHSLVTDPPRRVGQPLCYPDAGNATLGLGLGGGRVRERRASIKPLARRCFRFERSFARAALVIIECNERRVCSFGIASFRHPRLALVSSSTDRIALPAAD